MKIYLKTLNKIIIWRKPDNSYYYRIIKGHYNDYHVGYKNQYDHEIILIIDNLEYRIRKTSIKKRIKNKVINFIEKI